MLDWVPFRGVGRIMGNLQSQPSSRCQLQHLKFELMTARCIRSSTVEQQKHFPCLSIIVSTPVIPPEFQTRADKLGGFRRCPQCQKSCVCLQVVDAVGSHFSFGQIGKVVIEALQGFILSVKASWTKQAALRNSFFLVSTLRIGLPSNW